jgi:hypothetical protein
MTGKVWNARRDAPVSGIRSFELGDDAMKGLALLEPAALQMTCFGLPGRFHGCTLSDTLGRSGAEHAMIAENCGAVPNRTQAFCRFFPGAARPQMVSLLGDGEI